MTPRLRVSSVLFLLTLVACTPEEPVRLSPTPIGLPNTTLPASTPTPSPVRPSSAAPSASPTASPTAAATPTTSPGGSPNVACAPLTGGSSANRATVSDIRIAHNPGFDRIVFELAQSPGPGTYGMPPYRIEVASTFTAISGQPVRVDGNAFFGVTLQNTDAHNPNTGAAVLPASKSDQHPGTPLIREAKVFEDFEATVRTAIGLDRLVCPTVLTLTNPVRLAIDFPTPP